MNEEWLQTGIDLNLPSDIRGYVNNPEIAVFPGYMMIAADTHPDFFIAN